MISVFIVRELVHDRYKKIFDEDFNILNVYKMFDVNIIRMHQINVHCEILQIFLLVTYLQKDP